MRKFLGCLAALALAFGMAAGRDDDKGPLTDEGFVLKASEGGMAEVMAGKLAAKRASDAEVKEFAEKMVKDHSKANKELASLAGKKGFKVAKEVGEKHKAMAEKLAKLSGAAFDREYMAGMVKDHEMTVALFEKQGKSGKDEDLKDWAEKTLPTIKEHLKMAKEINGKVGKGR
jgi:putative membrane protein